MSLSRRLLIALSAGSLLAAGCTTSPTKPPSFAEAPPIVFVHGNGDSAALWQTTIWRFESNGWPRDRLHAIDQPYPLARDDDTKDQPGRSSTAQHMAYLKSEVEKVLKATGANQVVLVGNSRGGYAIRNYIQNGGGDRTVSQAILSGTPNHGVQAIKGRTEGNEFSGTGPFLMGLNAAKNANGDEVTGPVKWLTIRSDNNDKFAQPDGLWIGAKGVATGVTFTGPALKGASNVVIARIDHRETAYSPAAFDAMHRFMTGQAPRAFKASQAPVLLSGKVSGLGVQSSDPKSGNFANNLPLVGARVEVFAVDATGQRKGQALLDTTVGADGLWGPVTVAAATALEFVVNAPGYAISHTYRSAFARTSNVVHLRGERMADTDKDAGAVVSFVRPRGYFDPARDTMSFDGLTALPSVPTGVSAGAASSKIKPGPGPARTVVGEFNGERVAGRTWPAADGHLTVLELTN
jgi:triacylglycerol lipase